MASSLVRGVCGVAARRAVHLHGLRSSARSTSLLTNIAPSARSSIFSANFSSVSSPLVRCAGVASAVPTPSASYNLSARHNSASSDESFQVFRLLNLAAEGNVDELKELLNSGVNVNACGYDSRTALHLAASQGKLDVVKLLLERGANVNAIDRFGSTPLNDALQAHRSDIAAYLRQHGSSLGERQGALIQKVMQSAAQGNVDLLVSVFENSFLDVSDCYDYDKRTPLHLAAANGHFEVCVWMYGCVYMYGCVDVCIWMDGCVWMWMWIFGCLFCSFLCGDVCVAMDDML